MRLYKPAMLALFLLILVPGSGSEAQDRRWLRFGPATVELEGRLKIVWRYGPPNYGENPKTDAKERTVVVVLSKPVNVRGNPKDDINTESVEGVRRVQLDLFNLKTSYQRFLGRRVVVNGTLFHAITGHHYTKVLMEVHSINAVRTAPRVATKPSPQKD